MKKLISLIATAAFAFGLAGCSGDLHDDIVTKVALDENLKVIGSNSDWKDATAPALKANGDGTYTAVVVADAANVLFCLAEESTNWTKQIKDDVWTGDCSGVDNGYGAYNAKTKDLTAGSTYNFKFEPTVDGKINVTISEAKEPNYFLLDGYFIRSLDSDWNGTASNLLWNGVKDAATGDVTYTVEFTATAETQALALARQDWNAGRYECSADKSFAVDGEEITLESGKEKHPVVTGLVKNRPYNVVIKTTVDKVVTMKVVTVKYIDVTGVTVKNYTGTGKAIYALEAWIPNNDWSEKSPNKATVSDGIATIKFSSTRLTSDSISVQLLDYSDASAFWADSNKIGGGAVSVSNPKNFKSGILIYDCDTEELSFIAE